MNLEHLWLELHVQFHGDGFHLGIALRAGCAAEPTM